MLTTSKLELYRSDIPEICFSDITSVLKARIKDEQNISVSMVAVATSRGNLTIFNQRKLWKSVALPFSDCAELLLYRSFQPGTNKEFLILLSASNGAIAVDLQTLHISKSWPDAKAVEVKDEKLLGYPQVVIHDCKTKLQKYVVVSRGSDWEVVSENEHPLKEECSALNNVIEALENQLKNVHGNLLHIKKQISLRQSMCNRSLAALNDATNLKPKRLQAPSYTTRVQEGNLSSLMEITQVDSQLPNLVQSSHVWHFVDYLSDSWILGVTLTNTSDKSFHDIQSFFISNYEDVNYQVAYYQTEGKELADSQSSEFMNLLVSPNPRKSRTLEKGCDLVIVVTTTIPVFMDNAEVMGSIVFTTKLSDSLSKRLQLRLGTARLKFNDVCNSSMSFNPSMNDCLSLRRNLLGLVSLLRSEEEIIVSTTVTSASESFKEAALALNMKHLTPAQSYYGSGVYGHVVVLITKSTRHSLNLKILALSEKKIQWFLLHLKSSIPDDCLIDRKSIATSAPEFKVPRGFLNPVISLLSNVKMDSDDEPVIVEEPNAPQDLIIDQIRREFLRKQNKIFGIDKESAGSFNIPIEEYRKWQKSWFI